MRRIFVIGSSNTDMVVKCQKIPAPGETVVGGTFFQMHGGKGANQAVAAARLGGKTLFCCRIGDDANGRASLEAYHLEGIDTSLIHVEPGGKSGVALIMVDENGENCIAVASGTNLNFCPGDMDILQSKMKADDIVLLQLEIPIETVFHVAGLAKNQGAVVILDPAPAPHEKLPSSLLAFVDFILPNEHEASALAPGETPQEVADNLRAQGVKNVIITQGAQGCLVSSPDRTQSYPAPLVDAIDTTAAGDAFAGAFAVALAENKPVDVAIAFAQQAAALSVTKMGAQPSLPYRNEV
jgi:ribokinase